MVALRHEKWEANHFLSWLGAQGGKRYELEYGQVVELAAERARHARMKFSAAKALEAGSEASGLDCFVWPDGMSVVIDDSTVRLPDAAVQCAPTGGDNTVLDSPVILVEVIAASSVERDENTKLIEYFSLSSVMHYLLLSPERRTVVHFQRVSGGDRIDTRMVRDGQINLFPPGFSIAVADLLGPAVP